MMAGAVDAAECSEYLVIRKIAKYLPQFIKNPEDVNSI
jgi:hypothetical protein